MKKTIIFIILLFLVGMGSGLAIKTDLHKSLLGEDSKLVYWIEKSLGHNPPLIIGDIKGKNAPDFTLPTLTNDMLTLSDYQGKLVILNFWASWCPPCRTEIPGFIKTQKKYQSRNIAFIGVAIEAKEDVELYAKEVSFNYPITYGEEESYKVSGLYGNPDGLLPYTIVISPEQKILDVFNGFVSEETLEDVISKHLL